MRLSSPLAVGSGRRLRCTLAALLAAVFASAEPAVQLRDDTLRVDAEGQIHWIPLGPPHPLRSAGSSTVAWRRSGSTESVVAAVILRSAAPRAPASRTSLSHVGVLTPSGAWELRAGDKGLEATPTEWGAQGRRLFAWSGTRFDGCWPGDDEGLREVKIGFACDQGFVDSSGGSGESSLQAVEEMVSMANLVYENQLSIHLSVGEVLMPSQWPGKLSQAVRPCGQSIDARLNDFQVFARETLSGHHMGAFVQLTDCYRPDFELFGSTEIGVACVGTLCNPVHSYAVVSWNAHIWLTLAHELGHIFGARHAFEDGKGTTGGIMDYADGRWQGAYQFHPYNEEELCGFITRSMTKPRLYELTDCWRPYAPNASEWSGHWSDGAWSNCSVSCVFGAGDIAVQERRPLCLDYRGGILPDGKCPKDEQPADATQTCQPAARSCLGQARWVYGQWGPCWSPLDLECGAGRQIRRATCKDAAGKPRSDCPLPAPAVDKRGCSIRACEREAVWAQAPSWRASPQCSDETAYQVRELQCVDTATLQPAKAQRCPLVRPLPDFREVTVPTCPDLADPCCLDAACREYRVDEDCLRKGRHLDAATCAQNPSGGARLYAVLGGVLRQGMECDLAKAAGTYAGLEESFPGLPPSWKSLDALVAGPAGSSELLLFRGGELLRFSLEAAAAFRGYPRAIADEFDGIAEACHKCTKRISAALFDEDTETLRLWCGYGEVYCLSRQPWRAITKKGDWIMRPSQDMGVTAVRGALKERTPGITLLLANGSRCKVVDEAATCTSKPLPYFGGAADTSAGCERFAFCAVCGTHRCKTCEQGFELSWGRCVPFTARLWADFPSRGDSTETEDTLGRHGALDEKELQSWEHLPGPFVGSSAIHARPAMRLAPVLDSQGGVARMRRWSLALWVRGRRGATGTLLSAQQADDGLLMLSWGKCGPSVEYHSRNSTVWKLPCDESLAGGLVGEAWVRVGVDFQDDSVVLRIRERQLRREVDLGRMSLGTWSVGGADLDVSLLEVLDHEKWPRIQIGALRSTWPLIVLALVICLVGVVATACAWRMEPPAGMYFEPQGCLASVAEAFVNVANTLLALSGAVVTAGVFLLLALGPTGGHIGLGDVVVGLASGELAVAMLPLGAGLVLFAAGIAGIRMARTRDCCWILAYLLWMLFCLRLQYVALVYLDAIDPRFQRPELASLTDSELLRQVDSTFESNGQQPLLRETQDTFTRLMSRANYDCRLLDDRRASCSAEAGDSALIQCSQPYATARAFEELVNRQCSSGIDVTLCASCMEGFGRLSGAPDWDPREPASRVFCMCASNVLTYTRGWIRRLNQACRCLGIAEVALLASVLYLVCWAPDRNEMLMRQVSRVTQAPEQLRLQGMRLLRSTSTHPSRKFTATSACVLLCGCSQLVAGILILHSAVFVVGKSAVLPGGLEKGALALGCGLVVLSSFACSDRAPLNVFYACGNVVLLTLVAAAALVVVAAVAADLRDPGELRFPEELHRVRLPGEMHLPNASLELRIPHGMREFHLPSEFRKVHIPSDIRLPNASLQLQIPNATDLRASISSFTAWIMRHDSARKVFVQAFDRGAYDCDVVEDDGGCSAARGIQCKASAAEDFEWAVNHLCKPTEACEQCLQALSSDPLEARNRVWCRCVGAFEGILRRAWPLALLLVAWQTVATVAAVKGACSEEDEELSDTSEDEPLIIEVKR